MDKTIHINRIEIEYPSFEEANFDMEQFLLDRDQLNTDLEMDRISPLEYNDRTEVLRNKLSKAITGLRLRSGNLLNTLDNIEEIDPNRKFDLEFRQVKDHMYLDITDNNNFKGFVLYDLKTETIWLSPTLREFIRNGVKK